MVLSRAGMTPPQLAPEVMAQRGGHGRQGVVLPRGPGGGWSPPHHRGTGVCPRPHGKASARASLLLLQSHGGASPPPPSKKNKKECVHHHSHFMFLLAMPPTRPS